MLTYKRSSQFKSLALVFPTSLALFILVGLLNDAAVAQDGAPTGPAATTDKVADKTQIAPPPVTPSPPTIPDRFNSPQQTLITFVEAMNKMEKDKSRAEKDAFACFQFDKITVERAPETAAELFGILNRLEYIETAMDVPDAMAVKRDGLSKYTYFPNNRFHQDVDAAKVMELAGDAGVIELVLTNEGWKFSEQAIVDISAIYKIVEPLQPIGYLADASEQNFSLWLRSKMPPFLKGKDNSFVAVEYYQWIGLLVIAFLGFLLDHILRFILRAIAKKIISRQHASVSEDTLRATVRPIGLVAATVLWLLLLRILNLNIDALNILLVAVRVVTVLAVTWAAWRLTDLFCEVLASLASRTATKFDDVLVPLIRKAIKLFIVAIGLIYCASSLNINIMPLLTGLGIGGLAFAFAAKDTIENLFGSVAVIMDRAFEVGDWVVIEDVEGTVEEVGFRSTRVRTFYNSLVTVPNATLVRAKVDNYGKRKYRRYKSSIGIQYDTPPEKVIAFTEGIREIIRSHPYTRKDYFQVWFNGMGPSSLDILLYVFHEVPDWSTELRERERMLLDIMRLANQLGVEFAFPTQTLHLYKEEHDQSHTASDVPGKTTDRRSMIEGIRAAQSVMENQRWQESTPGPVDFKAGPTDVTDDESFVEDRTGGS